MVELVTRRVNTPRIPPPSPWGPAVIRSGSFTLALVLLASTRLPGQQTPAVDSGTATTIRHLLSLTGSARLAVQGIEAMIPAQRDANPRIPAVFWDAFLARARRDTAQFVELLVPIYAAHLTRAELEALVRFYEQPLGKRLAEVLPLINQESIQAGQGWGANIGRQIAESLSQSGVAFPNP
jgi:uncharacterized protein